MSTTTWTRPEAIIFDMDGTLFKTETLVIPVHYRLFDQLRAEGLYTGETPSEQVALSCLGMIVEDIWDKLLPGYDKSVHQRADELMLQYEQQGLREYNTELYPQVKETLERLKQRGVRLFVASNGLELYVKSVADRHEISSLFEGVYSAGEYKTSSKVDLVRLLLDNHGVEHAWMVGDRSSDVEAGLKNNQKAIGCAYAGFGSHTELNGADTIISAFAELISLYDEAQ